MANQSPGDPLGLGGEDEEDQRMLISISEEMGVSPEVVSGEDNGGMVQGGGVGDGGMVKPEAGDANQMREYVCSTCKKTFDRPYRLQRHVQVS
jgi:hypothetical protein